MVSRRAKFELTGLLVGLIVGATSPRIVFRNDYKDLESWCSQVRAELNLTESELAEYRKIYKDNPKKIQEISAKFRKASKIYPKFEFHIRHLRDMDSLAFGIIGANAGLLIGGAAAKRKRRGVISPSHRYRGPR